MKRVFLSHGSPDIDEVLRFDQEMRRCGVPLWRDRADLRAGVATDGEIERASRDAIGFTFYLTEEAAKREWVRERERRWALQNAQNDGSCGIVPIFRDDRRRVTEAMIALGQEPISGDAKRERYDLGRFNGYVFRPFGDASVDTQLAEASETVLRSALATLAQRASKSARLGIGVITRGGPRVFAYPLDLLVDWTADYPPTAAATPHPGLGTTLLLPALARLWRASSELWPQLRFQIVPQCHLSAALAVGFTFRRNTGADLDLVEVQRGEHWLAAATPAQPDPSMWDVSTSVLEGGGDVAAVFSVSQDISESVRSYITASGISVGYVVYFSPAAGHSLGSVGGALGPGHAAVLAATAAGRLREVQNGHARGVLHLFLAGPPAFAVILAQQLSNVGLIQTYEWVDGTSTYMASIQLRSS